MDTFHFWFASTREPGLAQGVHPLMVGASLSREVGLPLVPPHHKHANPSKSLSFSRWLDAQERRLPDRDREANPRQDIAGYYTRLRHRFLPMTSQRYDHFFGFSPSFAPSCIFNSVTV
jgi:hypothetical protein